MILFYFPLPSSGIMVLSAPGGLMICYLHPNLYFFPEFRNLQYICRWISLQPMRHTKHDKKCTHFLLSPTTLSSPPSCITSKPQNAYVWSTDAHLFHLSLAFIHISMLSSQNRYQKMTLIFLSLETLISGT